jgi:uncharacterized protein (TIGR02246 family)
VGKPCRNCAGAGFNAEFIDYARRLIVIPRQNRPESTTMRTLVLTFIVLAGLAAPAFAQKAEIEAANDKWVAFFNKGDFDGVASLYTADATAFPPGSGMVKGRAAIGTMWKGMAEQMTDPKVTTMDVKRLGPAAAREIGTFSLKTKSSPPKEVTGKYVVIWQKVGRDWKLATDIWNEGK